MLQKLLRSVLMLSLGLCLTAATVRAQTGTIKGHITDQTTGEALISANVFITSLARGAASDVEGNFTIEDVPYGTYELRISYVGYTTKIVNITVDEATETIEILLKSAVGQLDELVVTGLASSVKRSNLANAVAKVDAEELTGGTSPATVGNALAGKIPGVQLNSWSGAPGGGVSFQLRGISTLGAGSSQPLIIVDGVYISNAVMTTGRGLATGSGTAQDNAANRLADLNPEDIASIEILKGPSAAAIYGQRANAGVVIITTKSGEAGETHVSINQSIGFTEAANFLGRANWNEERIIAQWDDAGKPGLSARTQLELDRYHQAKDAGMIRDLEKEFYGNKGLISNTQISVSGGNQKTQFYVSGNLDSKEGIIKTTDFNRKSVRANIDHNISEAIHVSSSSGYIHTLSNRGFTNNQNTTGGSIGYTMAYTPNYAYGLLQPNADGTYPDNPYFGENPFRLQYRAVNTQTVNRFIQSLAVNADLFRQGATVLSLAAQGGLDYINVNANVYFPNYMQSQKSSALPGDVIYTTNQSLNLNLQAVLKFNTLIKSNSSFFDLGTQVGITRFDHETKFNRLRGQGLIPGQTNIRNATRITPNQFFTDGTDIGIFAQQKINWNDAVIATVGGRMDRSSLNLQQGEYYFYPKASLAVNLPNFDFWPTQFFDQLKLRVAYGETGGLPTFGNTFLSLGTTNIGEAVGTLAPGSGVDPNLKPERATELEFGIDLAFLDSRVALSATYYDKTVENLILGLSPAPSTGVNSVITNAASLVNKGVELTLNITPVQTESVIWNTSILWWTNETTMTNLKIPAQFNNLYFVSTRFEEGVSPTAAWGTTPESDGKVKLGNFQPDYQMSWSNSIIWSNFEFSFYWHASQGFIVSNLSTFLSDSRGNSANYWANYPELPERLSKGLNATRFLEDGSYIRLEQASIYYTLSDNLLQNAFGNAVRSIKIGISGRNLLLITDYSGYDPEVSSTGRNALGRKLSISPYPSSRQFMFHLSLDF